MTHEERNDKEERGDRGECIRSVERAIDVLQALNRRPLSTLHDLHRDTGLPKPSIVRLLRTLEAKGLAAQSSSYGAYQLLSRVKSLASGFHHEPQIVEVAEELMIEFTRQEGWPLSLALFDLNAMVVRACTIRFTALSLEHAAINRRLSLLTHAMGRAYLAFSAENERAILLSILRSQRSESAALANEAGIAGMIAQVRERGYALRDPLLNPRSSTVAVPVFENGRVVATLGFTWIAAAMTVEQAVGRFVPGVMDIARDISRKLEETGSNALPPGLAETESAPEWSWAG
ncbi:MAG TPA: DNA-binding transcriptional regulator [Croceibacterium sp.]|nr:DNA-binding transcriptional regulator [Croceibacterium sp.]